MNGREGTYFFRSIICMVCPGLHVGMDKISVFKAVILIRTCISDNGTDVLKGVVGSKPH